MYKYWNINNIRTLKCINQYIFSFPEKKINRYHAYSATYILCKIKIIIEITNLFQIPKEVTFTFSRKEKSITL